MAIYSIYRQAKQQQSQFFISKTLPSFVPEQAILRFSSEVGQYSAVVIVVTVGNADQHFKRSRHLPGSELRSGEDRLAFG